MSLGDVPQADISPALRVWLQSVAKALDTPMSTIKSIQQGAVTINAGSAVGNATITAVDPTKAVVHMNGFSCDGAVSIPMDYSAFVSLADATTVQARRSSTTGQVVVAFTVVEYT
jgi:hypothetical protein